MLTSEKSNELASVFAAKNVRKDDSYINSLPYYLLTGRYGAQIYTKGAAHIVTCQHPHKENTTLVFPEIGGDGNASAELLIFLQGTKGYFQLARYTKTDLHKLKAALALHVNRDIADLIPIPEDSLDWAHPIRVLDTRKTGEMLGRNFDTVRNKFNKIADSVRIERVEGGASIRSLKATLHFWIGGLMASGHDHAEERSSFYKTLIQNVADRPALFDGFVVHDHKEPVGFTIWDRGLGNIANSLASISRRSVKGLSEFQIVSACRILQSEAISLFNLGGSENIELDRHKLKFQPVHSVDVNTYKIEFKENSMRNFQVIKLT